MEPEAVPASVELPSSQAVAAVAALGDESRRRLYEIVRAAGRPVTRDEAAAAVGISRKLAGFHLDKLVEVELLHAEVAAPGGVRRVGRRPKVYRPSEAQVGVSIPSRSPDLLAGILVEALDPPGNGGASTVAAVAHRRGRELGTAERERTRPGRLGTERALTAAGATLTALGFEPRREHPTGLTLRNCPFRPHAGAAPELVCALNHALITGLLEGLRADTVTATLTPQPRECCVTLSG
ncbi:helix-turn-helix transcriptional regulator [Actinomycetospora chlora]|uniref:helix-turn-helix transcriptional regulator n=1 Tax=Actinomycetospora chlora TaxID=663608 RepID=UPI0031E902CD